jgi:hypothetical protein
MGTISTWTWSREEEVPSALWHSMVVTDIAEKNGEKDQTMSGTERHNTDEHSIIEDMKQLGMRETKHNNTTNLHQRDTTEDLEHIRRPLWIGIIMNRSITYGTTHIGQCMLSSF